MHESYKMLFHQGISDYRVFQPHNQKRTGLHTQIQNKNRPGKGVQKVTVIEDNFTLIHFFDQKAYDQALLRCSHYSLITNKSETSLSIEEAMMTYKNQYKSEHINRRAKSSFNIEPTYLHTPERIEAFLFLFKIALQVIVLIERSARKNIKIGDKKLNNFMQNRKDVRNPRTGNLLAEFQYAVSGEIPIPDDNQYGFVSDLTIVHVQKNILEVFKPFSNASHMTILLTQNNQQRVGPILV
ncbi:MAG: transposase [Desulfobacteraceae bacterium]|nr:transposase [Desulfobacteraceae bacterium]